MTDTATPSVESLVHVVSHAGHHAAYQGFLGRMLDLAPATGPLDTAMIRRLSSAARLLFATLDDDVFGFARTALARALRGRRTAGLFLHATSCFAPGMKARVKRALFATLKRLPGVSIISILPFDLFPETRAVASAAIADPQLWDQLERPDPADAAFCGHLRSIAAGRPVLAYVGWATAEKDFDFLSRVLEADPDFASDICVVAAGRVAEPCQDAAKRFCAAGGVLFDRFVTDEEIASLYGAGDLIWVCYAPGYDQASGIFGRSVQRGRPVAIRESSTTIAHFCRRLEHPYVRLPADAAQAAWTMRQFLSASCPEGKVGEGEREMLAWWREEALTIMQNALSGGSGTSVQQRTNSGSISVA